MRSKVPCIVCGTISCPSGFVFKNCVSKCVCRICCNRQKRFEKVTAAREVSSSMTMNVESIEEPQLIVINLVGMFSVTSKLIGQLLPVVICMTLSYKTMLFSGGNKNVPHILL